MQNWLQRTAYGILVLALMAGGCATAEQAAEEVEEAGEEAAEAVGISEDDESVAGRIASDGNFETLEEAIVVTNLVERFQEEGPFTVFGPTDAAFGEMSDQEREAMMEEHNREELRALILNHTVEGRLSGSDLQGRKSVETIYGNTLRVRRRGGNLYVGGAQVLETDLEAENGFIHAVDQVIR